MENNVSASSDPFSQVFQEIYNCKRARTCPSLKTRQYFFEPNASTLPQWLQSGIYSQGIDSRVVFVCESPGPSADSLDFPNIEKCWSSSSRDKRFSEVRKRFGLENCFLTNTVKCGPRQGSSHSSYEIKACIEFLLRELEIIKPGVVVAVGGQAAKTIFSHVIPRISSDIKFTRITHYSARRNPWDYWNTEFPALLRLIK
jgi:uracil-DNA glycosylase family 4